MLSRARQRGNMSCGECNRRKIRCDKKVPCRACLERGEGDECRPRQVVPPRPRSIGTTVVDNRPHPEVQAELASLRRRLEEVESALGISRRNAPSQDDTHFKENGLAGAMEEAALGIGQDRRWRGAALLDDITPPSGRGSSWFSSIPFDECLSALPSRVQSQILLEWYCDRLDWMFGCLHRETITRQHDAFWTSYEQDKPIDGMDLGLIFAVLSVSAYFFDNYQAQPAMPTAPELEKLALTWFNCSLATFFRCDGLTKPSLSACRLVITLNYAFNLSGNTPIHSTLSNALLGVARSINLHLLGGGHSGSDDAILRRELGRRAWWQIVETDWSFLPYHRYASITPHQFDTSFPELADQSHASTSLTPQAHSLSYLLVRCRSATILYDLYSVLKPTERPSYQAVLSASENMDQIINQLPAELREDADALPHQPSLLVMRRYLGMMMAYRSYLIHRAFFVESLRDESYLESRTACIAAAEKILSYAKKGLPPAFMRLWTTTLWLVSTGIILALDLLHASKGHHDRLRRSHQREKLIELLDMLKSIGDKSGIGSRGSKLIAHLCSMEPQVSSESPSLIFTPQQISNLIQKTDAPADTELGAERDDPEQAISSTLDHFLGSNPNGGFFAESDFGFRSPAISSLLDAPEMLLGNPLNNFDINDISVGYGQADELFKYIFPDV